MKKRLAIFLASMLFVGVQLLQAQTTRITGTVTSSEDGMPLPGVSVIVKGTTVGSATDINGKFELNAPANSVMLTFSFIGYVTQDVAIGGRAIVDVVLTPDSKQIEEVIVVAYGTSTKQSFTGSVSSVGEKQITKIQTSNVSKALEGMVAGVTVSAPSGRPGGETSIRIRGIGSINSSSEPLLIVDGSPYEGSFNTINPADIASFNILKDAASAALYGARGANGVILITTKKGKSGETVVNFDAKYGYNFRGVPEYDIITSPSEFYEKSWLSLYNSYRFAPTPMDDATAAATASNRLIFHFDPVEGWLSRLGYNIYNVPNDQVVLANGKINPAAQIKFTDSDWNDWYGSLFKPQKRSEYNLSISKGNENSRTYFSVGYLDDKGYTLNSYYKRLSTRLNYSSSIYKWLDFDNNIQFTTSEANESAANSSSYVNTFSWARFMPAIYPVYKRNMDGTFELDVNDKKLYDFGNAVYATDGTLLQGTRAYAGNANIVGTQNEDMDYLKTSMLTNSAKAIVKLPLNFKVTLNATLAREWYFRNRFQTPIGGDALMFGGRGTRSYTNRDAVTIYQLLNWNYKYNDFNIGALLGHEYYQTDLSYLTGSKTGFLDPDNTEFTNAAKMEDLNSYSRQYKLEGYFSQLTVDYKEKYYLSASARRDASSIFHPDHRWGTFWSVGGAWRVSEEAFFAGLKDVVNSFRLKASHGAQGNDYLFLANSTNRAYSPYVNLYEVSSDGSEVSLLNKYKGTKDITWETNINSNVGFDAAFLNGMFNLEFEVFQRTTKDMLYNLPIDPSTGFSTEPRNIGDMRNRGFELTLNANIINTEKIRWSAGANITHYKNEVISLPEVFKESGIVSGSYRLKEGSSRYEYYMVKYAGVDPTNGNALYYLKNANHADSLYHAQPYNATKAGYSKQECGSSLPDLQGGFFTQLEAYGVDFSANFSYGIGGKINDGQYASLMNSSKAEGNWHADINDSWSYENPDGKYPRIEYNNQNLAQASDRFLTDASYLALRNVTLGYTLPKNLTTKYGMDNVRFYFVVDNVALWSKRKGLDPRMYLSGDASTAVYSPIRSMSVGLNVKF